jgi:maltooligosyltrehalose trehalohydrolase
VHRGRVHGRPVTGLSGDRFVIATQTHDQVGNRATGERLAALVPEGQLKVAAALLLTAPFVPMLFMGEEWAASTPFQYFTDHEDPELGRAVTEGRRREFAAFGWNPGNVPDPQAPETFARSVLRWDERLEGAHGRVLDWYRRLVDLRRRTPALADGDLTTVRADADSTTGLVAVERGAAVLVVANIGRAEQRWPVGGRRLELASDPGVRLERHQVVLPVDTVAILTESP